MPKKQSARRIILFDVSVCFVVVVVVVVVAVVVVLVIVVVVHPLLSLCLVFLNLVVCVEWN